VSKAIVERIELLSKICTIVLAVIGAALAVILPGSSPGRALHFGVFLLREATLDLGAILGVSFLFWMAAWSGWMNFPVQSKVLLRRRAWIAWFVCLILMVAIIGPIFFFVRARTYFWLRLSGRVYAEQHLKLIDDLARTGRIRQAHQTTVAAVDMMKNSEYEPYFSERVSRLSLLIERSDSLATLPSAFQSSRWNPVSGREEYFRLAEAVRIDPQNYAAAEVLEEMVRTITKVATPKDERLLCGASVVGAVQRPNSVSVLEGIVLEQNIRQAGGCYKGSIPALREMWALDRVGCVLGVSRAARVPFDASIAEHWDIAIVEDCRGLVGEASENGYPDDREPISFEEEDDEGELP
jgi:hypothetical protein